MAATQEELEFLEGRHLDSEKTASLSQHSVKRSSTIKKTKRKTLVRDSKKSQSSGKNNKRISFTRMLVQLYLVKSLTVQM